MTNNAHNENGHHKQHKNKHGSKKQNGDSKHQSEYIDESSTTSVDIFGRIASLPLVYDSVNTLSYYVKSAPYSDYVIDKSLNTFSAVQKYAEPYVEPVHLRLQPHIQKADKYAVKALDNIEQMYPIVRQPTSEILDSVTKPPLQYYADVKKTVEIKVAEPAAQTATALAKSANQRASVIVDGVEAVVDRWLPGSTNSAASSEGDLNQVMRLYDITTSLPTRVSILVNTQLDNHNIPHTTEDFVRIRDASVLLRQTTERIEQLNSQLSSLVVASKQLATEKIPAGINQKVVEARTKLVDGFDNTVNTVAANEKIQFLTGKLLIELEKTTEYVKLHGPTLPSYIQERLNPLFSFVNNQYQLVSIELKRTDILPSEKAANVLAVTQQQVLPLLKKSLDDFASHIRSYQQQYYTESERVLDGFKTSLKGLGVPVK